MNRKDYINFGLSLVAGCRATYTATATQIGPEGFSWDPANIPAGQEDFFKKNGFYITDADYVLRPEVIESYYYAYRITGDKKYQDWAWDAFVAINATTRAESGFSSITDVNTVGGGNKTDFQESFLFAEVMKYAYMIHAPVRCTHLNYSSCNSKFQIPKPTIPWQGILMNTVTNRTHRKMTGR